LYIIVNKPLFVYFVIQRIGFSFTQTFGLQSLRDNLGARPGLINLREISIQKYCGLRFCVKDVSHNVLTVIVLRFWDCIHVVVFCGQHIIVTQGSVDLVVSHNVLVVIM